MCSSDLSRTYLDSCASCVFRKITPNEAEELLVKISQNHDDWSTLEPPLAPPQRPTQPTKRGIHVLNPETMQEAKKSLKEKGIKAEEVKNLPPIEALCEPTTDPLW